MKRCIYVKRKEKTLTLTKLAHKVGCKIPTLDPTFGFAIKYAPSDPGSFS